MADDSPPDPLFRSGRARPDVKANQTNVAARAIIEAETTSRTMKTAKLREARLAKQRDESQPVEAPTAKKRKRKA